MRGLFRELRVADDSVSGCGPALSSPNEMHMHCQFHSAPNLLSGQTVLQPASKN
jgi:hypothetical protein